MLREAQKTETINLYKYTFFVLINEKLKNENLHHTKIPLNLLLFMFPQHTLSPLSVFFFLVTFFSIMQWCTTNFNTAFLKLPLLVRTFKTRTCPSFLGYITVTMHLGHCFLGPRQSCQNHQISYSDWFCLMCPLVHLGPIGPGDHWFIHGPITSKNSKLNAEQLSTVVSNWYYLVCL